MDDVVAIDGPSASGKSTVARRVATAAGRLYVDSGALYRAVTWLALDRGVDPRDAAAVRTLAAGTDASFAVESGAVTFTIDGAAPGEALRGRAVTDNVSHVAAVPAVREKVGAWLRALAAFGPLVVEGRDIGTAVFPAARHKFYLDASGEERARRRHAESVGALGSVREVEASIRHRDAIDSTRATAPLRAAPDAVRIDSTGMSVEDVVAAVLARVCARPGGGRGSVPQGWNPLPSADW